jgi:hypothetical protein
LKTPPGFSFAIKRLSVSLNFNYFKFWPKQANSDLADLEARQEQILSRLNELKIQVEAISGSKISSEVCLIQVNTAFYN